jgi:hypothetical protein
MRQITFIIALLLSVSVNAQIGPKIKSAFKYSTVYGAINGGNSIADVNTYSVATGTLLQQTAKTPFDFSVSVGARKIARFGYENRAKVFYDGTEQSYGDAATVGKVSGFEFLSLFQYRRLLGQNYLDQHHFLRYVDDWWLTKFEYLQNGFADIKYFEASQRFRWKIGSKFSLNAGFAQRISEPYGYDPLAEWVLDNGNLHYTYLALQEGYTVDYDNGEFYNPAGELVATSPDVWEQVVIPDVLDDYVTRKESELPVQWNHSLIAGFDFYHYTKEFWVHSWGSIMPYHIPLKSEYSYRRSIGNKNWVDYGGGFIFGWKLTKQLGVFTEGTYHKYWNRSWHKFSVGLNYTLIK